MKKCHFCYFCISVLIVLALVPVFQYVFAKEEKVAYLTFDDGPTLNTPVILSHLDSFGAKATFFVLEERIVMYPDYIRDILRTGNVIGLHGVSHGAEIYADDTSVLAEMEKTNSSLETITGKRSKLVRVPFGSGYRLTKNQAKALRDKGYILWDWNVDPRDSVGTIVPEKVLSSLKKDLARCKGTPVILFHDRKSTANLLPQVLGYLRDEGYTLLPISEKQTPVCQLKN